VAETEEGSVVRSWLVLTDGYLTERNAKTAHGVIHFAPDRIAAVVDPEHAGRDLIDVLPELGRSAPVVATVAEGLKHDPSSLLLGVATPGGWMPDHWRAWIAESIEAGLEIANGLHTLLADDAELVALAEKHGVRLWDVRVPPEGIPLFSGKSLDVPQRTVLTVGSDCAVGKMTVTLALTKAAGDAGVKAEFVATGQTGILIAGRGIAVDRVISDFTAGAAEQLILESNPDSEVLMVEGQGGLWHPAYSGVTLGLLHGSAPEALVLCHQAGREAIEEPPFTRLPSLNDMVATYELMARPLRPAPVACVAVNTRGLSDEQASSEIARIQEETGLPTGDVLRGDAPNLWTAVAKVLGG
jgi:uncharacterized NAD-dependent epimerase/dehydratase family protein